MDVQGVHSYASNRRIATASSKPNICLVELRNFRGSVQSRSLVVGGAPSHGLAARQSCLLGASCLSRLRCTRFNSERKQILRPCTAYLSPSRPKQESPGIGGPAFHAASPLSVDDLKQLTALHVGDVYKLGVVQSCEELAARIGTSLQSGLSSDQAILDAQRERYGTNRVKVPQDATFLELVWEALQDFTVIILLVAGAASLGLELAVNGGGPGGGVSSSGWIEGASILASVVVVVLVTAVNNYQKERQFRALQEITRDVKVRAIRGGQEGGISVFDVLVGDLVLVEAGDILPVDGVLVEGCDIKVDESHLTGESEDVDKAPGAAQALLSGSKVLSGFGRMLVTAVGPNSQAGQIAEMIADGKAAATQQDGDGLKEETMLTTKLASYANFIGRYGLAAAALVTTAMTARYSYDVFWVQHLPWSWEFLSDYLNFFILGVTILVVAVPEGLPLAVTLSLAYSVKRMLADNNLVRHLSAAETMGTATVICSDKTGTLTQNNMVVSRVWLCGVLLPELSPFAFQRRPPLKGLARAMGTTSSLSTADASASVESSAPAAGPAGEGERGAARLREDVRGRVAPTTLRLLSQALAVNSTANVFKDADGKWQKTGNRTEVALLSLGLLLGCDLQGQRNSSVVLAQAPFSSERKRMTTAVLDQDVRPNGTTSLRVFTKGAAEIVIGMCSSQLDSRGEVVPLSEQDKAALLAQFTSGNQRVLCLAYRDATVPTQALPCAAALTANSTETVEGSVLGSSDAPPPACSWDESMGLMDNLENDLVLFGVVGIEDPLRPEVPEAIRQCQLAGITVKMLTGDNVRTAAAIARQCGILPPDHIDAAPRPPLPSPAPTTLSSFTSSQGEDSADSMGGTAQQAQRGDLASSSNGSSGSNGSRGSRSGTSPAVEELAGETSPQTVGSSVAQRSGGSAGSAPKGGAEMVKMSGYSWSGSGSGSSSMSGDEWTGGSGNGSAWLEGEGSVMEGAEFRRRVLGPDGEIDGAAFREVWSNLRVLARCTPSDKFIIVKGVKAHTDEVIAVTGDGTNDAPALRAANVGFAMSAGTDTAKEAADIVLLDNNFASIVSAVLWGRGVYANITRFLQFQLTINVVAVIVAVTGAFVTQDAPLTAVQMLWVNLIMDSLASLALATEPPHRDLLSIPPFAKDHEFVEADAPSTKHILGQAGFQLCVMFLLVFHPELLGVAPHSTLGGVPSEHYTMVFNTFVLMQLFNQVNSRKILDREDVLQGLSTATLFSTILGAELLLQALIVQYGGMAFHTHPLSASQWGVCLGIGATTLVVREGIRRLPYGKKWERVARDWRSSQGSQD